MFVVYTDESTITHKTKRPRTSDDKREAPSQTERGHSTKPHSPSQEQSDSEEGGSYNSSSSESDSEGEKSDEDDELKAMEKNPRALEKKFAEEVSLAAAGAHCLQRSESALTVLYGSQTAYWVEQDASLSPSHRKSRSAAREASSTRSRSLSTHLAPPISRSPSPAPSNEVEHPKSQHRKAHGNDADRPTTSKKRPAREHSDAEDDTTSPVSEVSTTSSC